MIARAGHLQVPARADLAFDFLKVEWRTIQHYGVEIGGLRYDGPALNPYRNRTSPYAGEHAGRWPLRVDPGDVSRVWFQDLPTTPGTSCGGSTPTRSAARSAARRWPTPGSSPTAAHRFPDTRRALAELLEQWGAGLAGNRAGAADGPAAVRAAAAPGPGPGSPRQPRHRSPPAGAGSEDERQRRRSPAPRSPAKSPATTRATSTPTRWRPCEHAAAARRARLLAVHPVAAGRSSSPPRPGSGPTR